jgi:hypothetical protein
MAKKLLSKLEKIVSAVAKRGSSYNAWYGFSNKYRKNQVEKYLANSFDLYDLDYRQKELDRKGTYNKLNIQ